MPHVLIININRIKYDREKNCKIKINRHIDFSETTNVSQNIHPFEVSMLEDILENVNSHNQSLEPILSALRNFLIWEHVRIILQSICFVN